MEKVHSVSCSSAFETLGSILERRFHLGQGHTDEDCPKAKVSPEWRFSEIEDHTEQGLAGSGITRGTVGSCSISRGPEFSSSRSSRGTGAPGPRTEVSSAVLSDHCRWSSSGERCLFLSQNISFSICRAFRTDWTVENPDGEVFMVVSVGDLDCYWLRILQPWVQLPIDQPFLPETANHTIIREVSKFTYYEGRLAIKSQEKVGTKKAEREERV